MHVEEKYTAYATRMTTEALRLTAPRKHMHKYFL